jgi:hypothetical protein
MTASDVGSPRASQARLLAAAVLLAVAVAGAAAGVVIDRAVLMPRGPRRGGSSFMRDRAPSPDMRRRFSERMAKDLDLTPAQQVRIDTIMTRQFEGVARASALVRPTIDSLTRTAQAAMDSVLTPAQREKVATMRQHWHGPAGRGGPGRGGEPGNGERGSVRPPSR